MSYHLGLQLQRARTLMAVSTSIWRQAHYNFKLQWKQEALGWLILPCFHTELPAASLREHCPLSKLPGMK